jgi:hypothetical protein
LINAVSIKEFIVVKSVYEANKMLMSEYEDISKQLISKVNLSQYISKIKIPEIDLEKFVKTTGKVGKTSAALSKLGLKGADVVQEKTNELQKQIVSINEEIRKTTEKTKQFMKQDFQSILEKEITALAGKQVQKKLNLTDVSYLNFSKANFGLINREKRKITSEIYLELSNGAEGVFKNTIAVINQYFIWIAFGALIVLFVLMLFPILFVWWIVKKLSDNFIKCPYCGKLFLSKEGCLNIQQYFRK